jgi:hypothetical protein
LIHRLFDPSMCWLSAQATSLNAAYLTALL